MTHVYSFIEFAEEHSAGSDPSIDVYMFSTKEKREQCIKDWKEQYNTQEDCVTTEDSWSHWYTLQEIELDVIKKWGHILKQY